MREKKKNKKKDLQRLFESSGEVINHKSIMALLLLL